jgi:predicted lipid carrier protein YhbT
VSKLMANRIVRPPIGTICSVTPRSIWITWPLPTVGISGELRADSLPFLIARLKKAMRDHFDREAADGAAGGALCRCHRQEHQTLSTYAMTQRLEPNNGENPNRCKAKCLLVASISCSRTNSRSCSSTRTARSRRVSRHFGVRPMPAPICADFAASFLPRLQNMLLAVGARSARIVAAGTGHIATRAKSPALFARLGSHTSKRFLIDPTDLPFVLVLIPDAAKPYLKAYRRYESPPHDAGIAGTFFDLLDMIAGTLDGDALFFARGLRVSGDTEAVVALRNALDDVEATSLTPS